MVVVRRCPLSRVSHGCQSHVVIADDTCRPTQKSTSMPPSTSSLHLSACLQTCLGKLCLPFFCPHEHSAATFNHSHGRSGLLLPKQPTSGGVPPRWDIITNAYPGCMAYQMMQQLACRKKRSAIKMKPMILVFRRFMRYNNLVKAIV